MMLLLLALLGLNFAKGWSEESDGFTMTLNDFRGFDFSLYGGFGTYIANFGYHHKMTDFAKRTDMLGRVIELNYGGLDYINTVTVVARESTWHFDSKGSLRIAVNNRWGNNDYLYISVRDDGSGSHVTRPLRGVCIHSNQRGMNMDHEINCDGNAGQSCGMGLFGAAAKDELQKSGICEYYWQDSVESSCNTADYCSTDGSDLISMEILDRVSVPDVAMVLFDFTVWQMRNINFDDKYSNKQRGVGNYVEQNDYWMTTFAQWKGWTGKQIRLEFTHGHDVIVTVAADTWVRDQEGSIAIKVENMVGENDHLHIVTKEMKYRGVCVHSNENGEYNPDWNYGEANCDGGNGQECGLGLFGTAADNYLTDMGNCGYGFWNDDVDNGDRGCFVSDYCIKHDKMRIKATLVPETMVADSHRSLFQMRIDTFHDTDWNARGKFGFFDEQSYGFLMTPFATWGGFMGRTLYIDYSNGKDVYVTCAQDTWSTDAAGSLRIKVYQKWQSEEELFISVSDNQSNGPQCQRGVCVHGNGWNQNLMKNINCDGDGKQSCGFGLFGTCAKGEYKGTCLRGFWSDNLVSDCDDADYCVSNGADFIGLELLPKGWNEESNEVKLLEMTIGQYYDYDFGLGGGFAIYQERQDFHMDAFLTYGRSWMGATFKLEYSKGKPVIVTATEDNWSVDDVGGISIGVSTEVNLHMEDQRLIFSRTNERGKRGICVHDTANSNTKQVLNCDGNSRQSCGMGLFGTAAKDELGGTGGDFCKEGYWQDMESTDCRYADYCIQDPMDTITFSLLTGPTPEPTAEPTVEPTVEPTKEPTKEPTMEKKVDPEQICKLLTEKKACNRQTTDAGNCSWLKKKEKCKFLTCSDFTNKKWKCAKKAKKHNLKCYWDVLGGDKCVEYIVNYECYDYETNSLCKKAPQLYRDGGCKWDKKTKTCYEEYEE